MSVLKKFNMIKTEKYYLRKLCCQSLLQTSNIVARLNIGCVLIWGAHRPTEISNTRPLKLTFSSNPHFSTFYSLFRENTMPVSVLCTAFDFFLLKIPLNTRSYCGLLFLIGLNICARNTILECMKWYIKKSKNKWVWHGIELDLVGDIIEKETNVIMIRCTARIFLNK